MNKLNKSMIRKRETWICFKHIFLFSWMGMAVALNTDSES